MNEQRLNEQREFLSGFYSGKTILVSGATGLIGAHVVGCVDAVNAERKSDIRVVALYRDEAKRRELASALRRPDRVEFVRCDLDEETPCAGDVDYVVHCAGFSGGSRMHLKDPLRVFDTGINGTRRLLDYAVNHRAAGFLYVSTYEVYGEASQDAPIVEDQPCRLDPFVPRNCYGEIKRLCESLLCAFSAQYGLKTCAVRLTSTFGSGVRYADPRFFSEFARCAVSGRDIVLKSRGNTVRSYLDADDAATAFLYVLANGESCNAYNLTNRDNEISIRDIARRIIELSGADIRLVFDLAEDAHKIGMRREGKTVMDTTKIEGTGWKPVYTLDETLLKLIDSMKKAAKAGERNDA